jgi:serine/threonine protein kinase
MMESQWIWPFELLEKIGEGGMGVVYRARYVGNNRQVAVKLIPNDITANSTILARFERELEVLKQLSHPNIVHCFGGSCESKQRFYAMEYVPGGTLADYLIEKGPLSWEVAIDFAIQMCEALQYAHERGVTHRDIKPGNFLRTKTGQLKLSDFGLASIVSQGRLTASGRTVGTILYMSPEQIRGETATNRVDLYGLGCVLFEMLVGFTPYIGSTAGEVLQRHLKDPIPHVAGLVPKCPLELDQLVYELLAKDPGKRPASAADVASRLNGILLPSRQANAYEPDLFSSRKPNTIATIPLKKIKAKTSPFLDRAVSPPKQGWVLLPWIVAGLMTVVSSVLWYRGVQTAGQLYQAEKTWTDLLDQAEPDTRILAANALGKFPTLSNISIEKLGQSAKSPISDVRLASLKALKRHAAESRRFSAELIRIQKSDENTSVRDEARLTVAAIQLSARPFSVSLLAVQVLLFMILSATVFSGWWIWKKLKPFS